MSLNGIHSFIHIPSSAVFVLVIFCLQWSGKVHTMELKNCYSGRICASLRRLKLELLIKIVYEQYFGKRRGFSRNSHTLSKSPKVIFIPRSIGSHCLYATQAYINFSSHSFHIKLHEKLKHVSYIFSQFLLHFIYFALVSLSHICIFDLVSLP